jgi:hypothetical protein
MLVEVTFFQVLLGVVILVVGLRGRVVWHVKARLHIIEMIGVATLGVGF